MILSTGTPNKWYVPKCTSVNNGRYDNLIGKELGTVCRDLIVECSGYDRDYDHPDGVYLVVGSGVKASCQSYARDTQSTCYARIALQFASAGKTFKSAGGEMARMKYRLWFHYDRDERRTVVKRGFSAQ